MVDLARWLGQQLDEDERIARGAGGATWLEFSEGGWVYAAPAPMTEWKGPGDDGHHVASVRLASERAHIAEHDPARVLREIDAKRRVVEEYKAAAAEYAADGLAYDHESEVGRARTATLERMLRLLALPYVDREGYRPEWAPTD